MIFDEDDFTDDDEEFEEMSEAELIAKVPEFTSVRLCDIIVANRYLGFYKALQIPCMEELAKRRIAGDQYEFEQYIEDQLKDMPKIEFDLTNLSAALEQLKKMSTPR